MSRKAQYYILHIAVLLIAVGAGVFCGWLMALWALPYAYEFRGYYAIGSEWILIFLAGWFGCKFSYSGMVHILTH